MKRILFVTNGQTPNLNSLDFACYLAQLNEGSITGVLIDNSDAEVVTSTPSIRHSHNGNGLVHQQQRMTLAESARVMGDHCKSRNLPFQVFRIQGDPVHEIVNESRFSDLIVMDPAISNYSGEEAPSPLLREVLASIECPVIVSPDKFENINEVVFCFDGSDSSIFAMKQFNYLFPQMKDVKVSMVEVNHSDKEGFGEIHHKMKAWMEAHYKNLQHVALQGDVKMELLKYLVNKDNMVVVLGAYGRSAISQFFRKSTADVLIRDVDLPFFITHL